MKGSPPLTRGKVGEISWCAAGQGITPAYAGKRAGSPFCPRKDGDHPRLRGEKLLMMSLMVSPIGSPPLTRGKDQFQQARILSAGITPAYAGKSVVQIVIVPHGKDHPRLRGEKNLVDVTASTRLGSPPLTRGKVWNKQTAKSRMRITPAYAGKSQAEP